jgi:ketosteroid isomerase-like protein
MLLITCQLIVLSKNNQQKEIENLRQTELAFSKMCGEKGMEASFLFYADKDVIKLEGDGHFPIIGIDSLKASFGEEREKFQLQWSPTKVEVSKSADIGYTFGTWTLTKADGSKLFGVYYTVWKKQQDGSWKFIFDTGNTTPALLTKEQ